MITFTSFSQMCLKVSRLQVFLEQRDILSQVGSTVHGWQVDFTLLPQSKSHRPQHQAKLAFSPQGSLPNFKPSKPAALLLVAAPPVPLTIKGTYPNEAKWASSLVITKCTCTLFNVTQILVSYALSNQIRKFYLKIRTVFNTDSIRTYKTVWSTCKITSHSLGWPLSK